MAQKLSILMPVYNEVNTIEEIIRRVMAAELLLERELIIVDDCSKDGTRDKLQKINQPGIKVLFHEHNKGKGAAVRTAIGAITGDFAIIQDADLEYDPREYGKLLEPLLDGRADVVYGSRFLGGPHRVLYFWHYVGNQFLTTFSNAINNINLSDMETCYKAFKADVMRSLDLKSNRFGIEPEITAKVARRHCRIYEVPISYSGRGYEEGKKITWKDGLSALWCIIKFRFF
ncbi:MAG: glycosyltransferase family 2 protein [Planctomycetes bacterium]|nr:glycosyltransferase family 2 protein [Planctomycetota bacterium]